MKIYKLRLVKLYGNDRRETERIFLSHETAKRYWRIYVDLLNGRHGAAGIFPIEMYTMGAKIYVLNEECHGQIGYFLDKDKAYEAARDVVMENPYWTDEDNEGEVYPAPHEITRDQITDEEIDDYRYEIGITAYELNSAWCQ